LHADLNDAVKEKEELSRQMQDYVIEVKRCQELLSAKVYVTYLTMLVLYGFWHLPTLENVFAVDRLSVSCLLLIEERKNEKI